MEEAGNIVVSPGVSEHTEINDFKWTVNTTKMLIDLYKKYRHKVGTLQLRSVKQMWHIIAKDLSQEVTQKITANNCENKWRVLDRNYKKFIENKTSTGRGRKYFDFAEEMESIYGNKRNVLPEILLSAENIHMTEPTSETPEIAIVPQSENSTNEHRVTIRKNTTKQRNSALEEIRKDRLLYQEKKLEIEMLKLGEMKRRNDLIEERNNILREKKCNCSSMSTI